MSCLYLNQGCLQNVPETPFSIYTDQGIQTFFASHDSPLIIRLFSTIFMTWQRLLAQSMAVLEGRLGKERVAREDLFFHLKPQDISVTFAVTVLSTTNVTINDTSGYIIHVYVDLR